MQVKQNPILQTICKSKTPKYKPKAPIYKPKTTYTGPKNRIYKSKALIHIYNILGIKTPNTFKAEHGFRTRSDSNT